MSDRESPAKKAKIEEVLPTAISEEAEAEEKETVHPVAVKLEEEESESRIEEISDPELGRYDVEYGPPQLTLLELQQQQELPTNPEAVATNYGNPSRYLPVYSRDEAEKLKQLERSRTRLIHTGPSVYRLDSLLEAQAEISSESRRILVLADRVNFLICAQINKQLGLYAARYSIESSLNEEGVYPCDVICTDYNGQDVSKNDTVRTATDSDPDQYCFGRVVQVTGQVVIILLDNQERHIARLGRHVWVQDEDSD